MARKQAKRGGNGGTPAWVWAFAGLALGLMIAAYFFLGDVWKNRNNDEPTPNPAAEAPVVNTEEAVAQEPIEKPKPKYDFYTLLPEKEVLIPDAELKAQAEAEAMRNAAPKPVAHTPEMVTATPEIPTADNARFLIQAGAFKNPDEAENLKATIALTGEVARIETADINGTTVYRVRLGPYSTASSLSSAKQALSSHGIEAQAIKVK
jgi:cell division protein FtsN